MSEIKSVGTIKKEIRALRKFIDAPDSDLLAKRVAYAVETALRWVTEDVKGWPNRVEDVQGTASIIRQDLEGQIT